MLGNVAQWGRIFEALRYRNYRIFWLGMVSSVTGYQILVPTQTYLAYELTGSALLLGTVGLMTAAPAIALSLFGGVVADQVDQRRLLMVTQSLSGSMVVVVTFLAFTGLISIWHILALAFLIGSVQAFDGPTRQALYPHLVARKDLGNAVALNSSVWQGTRIIGPSIFGVLVGTIGVAACYLVSGTGMFLQAVAVRLIQVPPIPRARGRMLAELGAGLGFLRHNPLFLSLIGMTFFNSMFGMSYIFLMPIFAQDILGRGPEVIGALLAMSGLGALLGVFIAATLNDVQQRGLLIIGGAVAFGAFLMAFAYSSSFILSMGLVFFAGLTNFLYLIAVMTTLQVLVPDEFRGRVMGFYGMTWSLAPLGAMQAGAIANFLGAPFAVALGGMLVIAFALVAAAGNTHIRRLRAPAV
ncbi:MAG: MFS transporter [Dehalococcoidia bacterium]